MKLRNSLLLFITALVWGVAFVAQDVGMDYLTPYVFNGVRSIIGGLVLLPVIFVKDRFLGRQALPWKSGTLLLGGVLCGALLCIGSNLQQWGIKLFDDGVNVGKAGFITAMYIIIVPIVSIFLGKKSGFSLWAAVAAALFGLYFLCVPKGGFGIAGADILILTGAFFFSAHILVIDYFSPKVDGVKMACIQFFVCGILSWLAALVTGAEINFSVIMQAWAPVLYAGALSSGVGYTLQIVGQKGLNPTVASLIMSLESCISAIAAWIILGDAMNARQIIGCSVMFFAIVLAQLPQKENKKEKTKETC